MVNILFVSIGIVIGVILTIIFFPKSKIVKTEEIENDTYDTSLVHKNTGFEIPNGKETRIVQKLTYKNGKIEYKTITYKH